MNDKRITISVGLDFGTYQTKACIRFKRTPNSPPEYHFVPLDTDAQGLDSLFLPSVISEAEKNRFEFGVPGRKASRSYSFFKIASADDEEFRMDLGLTKAKYDPERFDPHTPEFLAVVYVAYVITRIKTFVKDELFKQKIDSQKKGSFLDRFRKQESAEVDFDWVIQMGVPTEYRERQNALRKRKFQQILLMANELSKLVDGRFVINSTIEELKEAVQMIFNDILDQLGHNEIKAVDTDKWNELLSKNQVSVFPETAAGLVFLVRTGKLTKDKYYLAVDIGGGSTDVSFFKVEANETFTYYASKSVMVAANDLGIKLVGEVKNTMELRDKINQLFSNSNISSSQEYREAFCEVFAQINKHVYHMFNKQVYNRFEKHNATVVFSDTYCYLYGGGSLVPKIPNNAEAYLEKILIHDNGVYDSFNTTLTKVTVTPTSELQFLENITPENWVDRMQFLIVPLGLSLSMSDEIMTQLNEDFYTKEDLIKDPGLFDVGKSRWV